MSAGGGTNQDFELNLASIIDCFTVLIAFMLVTASFLSIGILDAGVAAAGATAASTTPPPVNLIIELKADHQIELKVQGKVNTVEKIAARGDKKDEYDLDLMTGKLGGLKTQWPTVSAITLLAENTIQYKEVIKTMESVKKTIPVVLLGGF